MPRTARQKSQSGIYHVMMRGINRENIFHEAEDYRHFLHILSHTRLPDAFDLYSYCLMSNHIHLLIRECSDDLSRTMKRINSRYVAWYNAKYDRVGPLFQDRFKSGNVEDDRYLLSVLRYIHQNPVKAQLVEAPEEYEWSSCRAFYSLERTPGSVLDTDYILGLFADDPVLAVERLRSYIEQPNKDNIPDFENLVKKSDASLRREILQLLGGEPLSSIQNLDKKNRDALLQQIKSMEGITQRQISRVLQIHASIIFKV